MLPIPPPKRTPNPSTLLHLYALHPNQNTCNPTARHSPATLSRLSCPTRQPVGGCCLNAHIPGCQALLVAPASPCFRLHPVPLGGHAPDPGRISRHVRDLRPEACPAHPLPARPRSAQPSLANPAHSLASPSPIPMGTLSWSPPSPEQTTSMYSQHLSTALQGNLGVLQWFARWVSGPAFDRHLLDERMNPGRRLPCRQSGQSLPGASAEPRGPRPPSTPHRLWGGHPPPLAGAVPLYPRCGSISIVCACPPKGAELQEPWPPVHQPGHILGAADADLWAQESGHINTVDTEAESRHVGPAGGGGLLPGQVRALSGGWVGGVSMMFTETVHLRLDHGGRASTLPPRGPRS